MTFRGIKAGDRIRFAMVSGGQRVVRTARVQPLLVFSDHVVVNLGGRHGTPYVVSEANYVGPAFTKAELAAGWDNRGGAQ